MIAIQLDINTLRREGTEVARYRVSSGQRVVICRRAAGGAEVLDVPAEADGRCYQVDSGYREARELLAFVKDYLAQAARFDACPMSREVLGALLCDTDGDLYAVMQEAL